METKEIFYIICGVICFIMLIAYGTRKRKVLSGIFGAVSGVLALFLICRYGGQIGMDIPMNTFNLCGSAVLGIPFVVLTAIICH